MGLTALGQLGFSIHLFLQNKMIKQPEIFDFDANSWKLKAD